MWPHWPHLWPDGHWRLVNWSEMQSVVFNCLFEFKSLCVKKKICRIFQPIRRIPPPPPPKKKNVAEIWPPSYVLRVIILKYINTSTSIANYNVFIVRQWNLLPNREMWHQCFSDFLLEMHQGHILCQDQGWGLANLYDKRLEPNKSLSLFSKLYYVCWFWY